jgi:hypothetical protein
MLAVFFAGKDEMRFESFIYMLKNLHDICVLDELPVISGEISPRNV